MSYPYKGQDIVINIDTLTGIQAATNIKILFKKPNGDRGEWTASAVGSTITYNATNGELDQAGLWEFQGALTLTGQSYITKKVTQYVEPAISI